MITKMDNKVKTLVDKYKVGDKVEVIISKPNIGNFPIGIIEEGHVVCLFERTKKFFEIDSIWEVEITEVKPKNLVIKNIRQVKSKSERETKFHAKLQEFVQVGLKSGNIFSKLKSKFNKN